ncbi:E3 ubiquitin/ISG15 ligase TRIM25 isoform X2 [Carcharodon carcharias]|uniref:E3 ubiquitin/ISG15 ligase TRIM25 isoform X2 n=1 Tax=Carcharodon carcharias TaxID=13397 RepID=UPI001B7F6911|nr:E3 ubiquitin/ISG15 ligase TRIM25 isoform X2 [Carcharodon carcharias]
MAEVQLPTLEAELTCAVCLDLFRQPVTAPCGHNFCRDCLAQFWAGDRRRLLGFTCPQCRAHFPERPDLHPNRVLCAVVEEFERGRAKHQPPEPPPAPELSVPCDACPAGGAGAAAVQTCLTCLASFCSQHLEPHRQSPAFRSHNLSAPLSDLAQRRCPQHSNLLEFYCRPHRRCICASCLLEHRGCDTQNMEEARKRQVEDLKAQQKDMQFQIIQMQHHLELVQYQKQHLTDSSEKQRSSLSSEFNNMKSLIEKEEKIATNLIEEEENRANSQIVAVLDQVSTQLTKLKEYKEQLDSVLAHTGSMVFWKNIAELPVIPLDMGTPPEPIELDSRKMELIGKVVSTLKQALVRQLRCSLQQRMQQLEQAGYPPDPVEPSSANDPELSETTNSPEGKQVRKKKNKSNPSPDQTQRLAADNIQGQKKPKPKQPPNPIKAPAPPKEGDSRLPLNTKAISQTRQELMQYNSRVTFDHRTAHKKLVIADRYTTLSVADQPQSYPDLPERFFNCSQVLGLQSFTNGRHYWEVNNDGSSFWAIGIAYSGMDRRGSRSRLGRNLLSWCVESFGQKLSFWHGDQETVLSVQRPRVVGVFLDFEAGIVAFYSVTNAIVLLFGFKTVFQGRVHPAFWLSSSGTKLTLVQ